MIGSLLPVKHSAATESTAGREVCDHLFPVVDKWHGVQMVEKAQVLDEMILSVKFPGLFLTRSIVMLLKVDRGWIQLIAIGAMDATS